MGEKKTNALSKSMKLIYVYAMATGAIFTFMCYWDGIFMSYTGPGTFLAFALMTLAVLPTAFVCMLNSQQCYQVQVHVWYSIR